MRREPSPPRPDFADEAATIGFTFASAGGETYWNEGARWVFSLDEIENSFEVAAKELHALSFELVDRVVGDEEALTRLAIPRHAWDLIYESWLRGDPSLYGRFDLGYDGKGPPKLLEYNADTPTRRPASVRRRSCNGAGSSRGSSAVSCRKALTRSTRCTSG